MYLAFRLFYDFGISVSVKFDKTRVRFLEVRSLRKTGRRNDGGLSDRETKVSLTDEELIALLKSVGASDAQAFDRLVRLYRPLTVAMVDAAMERYRAYGAERDDLEQEAAIALYKAAMSYNTEQSAVTFGLYAKVCVRNRLISVGRKLINHSKTQSIQKRSARSSDTDGIALHRSCMRTLSTEYLDELSPYERRVYAEYVNSRSCAEIAALLGRSEKSVENAIYRIRVKIKKGNSNMPE